MQTVVVALLLVLAACGSEVQEGYYDDDVGSPSQGAPLEGGEEEIEDFEEEDEEDFEEEE